ncbi:hypothetical protein [Streptomyces niveiscabiei]|uniref:hypothetical protein n=1 Tax=Streptomyces niveiscabiei TaxID=164115 RepID=UPI000B228D3B|nr:hypothetical protein [Streptomyces niveiscabiei]
MSSPQGKGLASGIHQTQNAPIQQSQAPASGVSVPRNMGVGSDLVHSLDYVVLLQVMFNLASAIKSTPMEVWRQLQERGIRSAKNANELVGKNAVYESFARLVTAGYMRREQLPHPEIPGRKGPVVYTMYDNPAWNPDWNPAAHETSGTENHGTVKPQVATLPGTPDASFGEAGKTAGQNASLVPGSGMASPPHPPEEEDSSSPSTPTGTSGSLPSQRHQQQRREAEFPAAEIAAAEVFLQQMDRWQAGAATARRCAPRLLRVMQAQGWPSLVEMDVPRRKLLESEIFKNTGGAKSWTKCLSRWIDDLRVYSLIRQGQGSAHELCPDHPRRYRRGCVDCAMAVPN